MNNKLDVFEILNVNKKQDQEQRTAPDFDFVNVRELLAKNEPKAQPAAKAAPVQKPQTASIQKPQTVPVVVQKSQAAPAQQVVQKPQAAPAQQVTVQKPQAAPAQQVVVKKPQPAPETKPVEEAKVETPQPQVSEPKEKKASKIKPKTFTGELIRIGIVAVAVVLLFTFVLGVPRISTNSMEPLISNGDRVVINRLAKDLDRGDIVVYEDMTGAKVAGRVVAVDGDVVSLNNVGGLYINNKLQTEEHIHTVTTITDVAVAYPVIVDEDTYFVLGDNRTDSIDSRNLGLIDKKDIKGKVIFCFKIIK